LAPADGSSADLSSARGGGRPTANTTSVLSAPFIAGVFGSANALRDALRDDLDDAVLAAGWSKCVLAQEGVQYVAFFRSALEVALLVLREADKVHLSRDAAEVGDRRERTINGETFMEHEDVVDSISSGHGFVLGTYVHSEATLLSLSGDTLLLLPLLGLAWLSCVSSFSP